VKELLSFNAVLVDKKDENGEEELLIIDIDTGEIMMRVKK